MIEDLWEAKVKVIASFAGGPAMMLDDESERDRRVAGLLALVEMEYAATEPSLRSATVTRIPRRATVIPLHGEELSASNNKIDWPALIEALRQHPNVSKTLVYDKMHTATVSATRTRTRYPDIDCVTERRGEKGALILTFLARRR